MPTISKFAITDVYEGQSFNFDVAITDAIIDGFAELTGDTSPLHIDDNFAIQRGFKGRVVHGALLCGLVSRLIGVHLPGQDSLLLSMNMKFPMPTYVIDLVQIKGVIDTISLATMAITLKIEIINKQSHSILAKGKLVVGFTVGSKFANHNPK